MGNTDLGYSVCPVKLKKEFYCSTSKGSLVLNLFPENKR